MNKPIKFQYMKTDFNFISYYKDGQWDEGTLREDDQLNISVMSTALQYGQEAFEGCKAYRRADGRIQLFRIEENARRFQSSCARIMMPTVPVDMFISAVKQTVLANAQYVPEYGTNATLYIRPYMIGVGGTLSLKPSSEYIFGVIVMPVPPYFTEGMKSIELMVSEFDRAAPNGVGAYKVGGNYASSLHPQCLAKSMGFSDCVFLDPTTHTKIEEVGAANFFAITKDLKYVTPKSPSILKGITNRSLMYIARNLLHMEVIETDIYIDRLDDFIEAAVCGTAAVVAPIRSILYHDKKHVFLPTDDIGHHVKQLYETLIGIQYGDLDDPDQWITILD